MSAILANVSMAVALLLVGVALMLAVIGLVAYARLRHGRMIWVSIAFMLLALQGALDGFTAYQNRSDPSFPGSTLLALGVALALYLAVLKR